MAETTISVIIEGGKATAGPPLAPALAPLGVNIVQLIADLNKQTAAFEGTKVPVKVIVDKQTKKWRFEIGSPATSELIKKELKIEKGAKGGEQDPKIVGNLTMQQVIKIAKKKQSGSLAKNLKALVNEIVGTCLSMGVT
ncbi:MAG: 50S ribosomal protein L11, partial [Candidatus Micrarchaeota archaeon]|nr:50S ribosomal protein L11 [Candidatus Micrarchaeota archaeon]